MRPLRSTRPPVGLGRAAIAMALVVSGCGLDDGNSASDPTVSPSSTAPATEGSTARRETLPAPVQEIVIDATEYTFEITPDPSAGLSAGWTLLRFHNVGAEPHQAMFARIKDGVDMAELAAAGANDSSGAGAIEFVDMIGGVSYIDAGHETTAMVNLAEGLVMAMCYVPDTNGVAHALMGMTSALTVSGPSGNAAGSTPDGGGDEVLGTIEFAADGYRLPDKLATGWYRIVNSDSALHEMAILRLGEPIDDDQAQAMVEDLAANRMPQVEVDAVGGMGAVSAGFDGYLHLDLDPGDYLLVDFMPDPGDPRPHMLDGYWARFSV